MISTTDKLEALHTLGTRNYAEWNRGQLINHWAALGCDNLKGYASKAELVELIVGQDMKNQITEPLGSAAWTKQVDYYLDLLINEMAFEEKVELIVSGLVRDEWRAAL